MSEASAHTDQPYPDDTPDAGVSTLAPLCGEEEFTELVAGMVADEAPRLFAVVQEYGVRVDGRIAAWGMALDDRAEIVRVEGGRSMSLPAPERPAHVFSRHPDITARVVWVHPEKAPDKTDADIEVAARDGGAGSEA
ncbi:MAG TPA: hypothetical protein VFO16_19655 [Pseudonocardiaceae bacterium]|nr:hypothetical protein [Pseudonocardiaceae bacterium]